MVEGEDDKMAERWQKDAEGVILFVSLHDFYKLLRGPTR